MTTQRDASTRIRASRAGTHGWLGERDQRDQRGFFATDVDLRAWDSISAHDKGLNAIARIFQKTRRKTTTEPISVPYRHGIPSWSRLELRQRARCDEGMGGVVRGERPGRARRTGSTRRTCPYASSRNHGNTQEVAGGSRTEEGTRGMDSAGCAGWRNDSHQRKR